MTVRIMMPRHTLPTSRRLTGSTTTIAPTDGPGLSCMRDWAFYDQVDMAYVKPEICYFCVDYEPNGF